MYVLDLCVSHIATFSEHTFCLANYTIIMDMFCSDDEI